MGHSTIHRSQPTTGCFPEIIPTKPGYYVCIPQVTIHNLQCENIWPELMTKGEDNLIEGTWIVEIFQHEVGLCYRHPIREEDFLVESCSHKFYGPIN